MGGPLVIMNPNVVSSFWFLFHFPHLFSPSNLDGWNLNLENDKYIMSFNGPSPTLKANLHVVPFKPKIKKHNYGATKKIQGS